MRKSTVLRFILFAAATVFFSSCNMGGFKVEDFDPLVNYDQKQGDTLYNINADLSDAVLNGIEIPTKKQTNNGYFTFSFKVKNTSSDIKKYYYKIFYQNESYKFNDTLPLAHENFYGSWIEKLFTFKPTKILNPGDEIIVRDSFKVMGNPRNELKYFGTDSKIYPYSPDSISSRMNFVRSIPKWMADISVEAKKKNVSIDEAVYYNAVWSIEHDKNKIPINNNRWKRNPRMGVYDFMLVVSSPEDLGKIPMEVRNIQTKDKYGNFINPFGYFLFADGKKLENTKVFLSKKKLKVSSQLDLGSGIFVDLPKTEKSPISLEAYNSSCGNSYDLYEKAQFSQYFHSINTDYTVYNIPEIKDVTGDNLTRKEYEEYLKAYADKNKRVKLFVNTTNCPCATVKSEKGKLTMINPASKEKVLKKEHVGMGSRIGFTYGKFRAKIKFPEMLSKDLVWNGITNAFWLLFQTGEWNNRRDCNSDKGYLPKSAPDHDSAFKYSRKTLDYSEIDFEIVKESQYWPKTSYNKANVPYKTDDTYNNNKIMVTCTNWDMSCHEPPKYNIGVQQYKAYDSVNYVTQRWNYYYKALSSKVAADHDELFRSPYYYFEVEWQPEKIIWKIGPEKDKLRIICVMDKTFTSIPNNQMRVMFTQEWHNEEWWPTAPYKQNFIPFPKKDLIGSILEIEIE